MNNTPRIIARIMSAIIITFSLFIFIVYIIEGSRMGRIFNVDVKTLMEFALMGIGVLGLALAWKWEKTGGFISLFAFGLLLIVNTAAFILPMFIPPLNAILFIGGKILRDEA